MNTLNPDHPASDADSPDQPLDEPLPYGTGFSSTPPLGFGVGPADAGWGGTSDWGTSTGLMPLASAPGSSVEVSDRKKSGSPVLAVAGILSMAVAVWAILGGPVIAPTVLLASGLVLAVIMGLVMVLRR